LKKIHHNFK